MNTQHHPAPPNTATRGLRPWGTSLKSPQCESVGHHKRNRSAAFTLGRCEISDIPGVNVVQLAGAEHGAENTHSGALCQPPLRG